MMRYVVSGWGDNIERHGRRDMYLITTVMRSACNNNAFMFTIHIKT